MAELPLIGLSSICVLNVIVCLFIKRSVFYMHLPGNELKFSLMAANDDGIAVKFSLDFPMSAALFWKRGMLNKC